MAEPIKVAKFKMNTSLGKGPDGDPENDSPVVAILGGFKHAGHDPNSDDETGSGDDTPNEAGVATPDSGGADQAP